MHAGVAIISIAAALCYWRGRDLPVEETFRGSMYSYDVGTGSRKRLREYRIHSVRGKEPLELEAFSDRLAVTSYALITHDLVMHFFGCMCPKVMHFTLKLPRTCFMASI